MSPLQYGLLIAIMAGFTAMEFVLHRAQRFQASAGDNTLDMLGFALLASITRQYPPKVGLVDDERLGAERWWVELFYPVFRSQRQHSALVPGGRAYIADDATAQPDGQNKHAGI